MNLRSVKIPYWLQSTCKQILNLLLFGLCLCQVYGQEAVLEQDQLVVTDSMAARIPFNEIFIAAGESRVRTTRMAKNLVDKVALTEIIRQNDSTLHLIEDALEQSAGIDYHRENQRFLMNQRVYWQRANKYVSEQKDMLSDLVRDLQSGEEKLNRELQLWKSTARGLDSAQVSGNINGVILEVSLLLDSVSKAFEDRTILLIEPLNRTIKVATEMELRMEQIQAALKERTSLIYSKTSPLAFLSESRMEVGQEVWTGMRHSVRFEWNTLAFYFQSNLTRYMLYLVGSAVVFMLFFWLRSRSHFLNRDDLTWYQTMLIGVLKRPLSAAAILILFFAGIIFQERPPLLIDITILLLLIPLLDLSLKLSKPEDHRILYSFFGLMLMVLCSHFFQFDPEIYRFILIGIGTLELLFLLRLHLKKSYLRFSHPGFSNFMRFFVSFHLVITALGVVANLVGYVKFSRIAIEALVNNALLILVLFFLAVTLIGGLQFFIDSRYSERFRVIKEYQNYLKGWVAGLILVVVLLVWIDSVLRIFYIRSAIYDSLRSVFTREFTLGSMTFSLLNTFLFVLIIWLSVVLSRVLKMVLKEDVLSRVSLKKGVPRMIMAVAQFIAIALGILIAIRAIGMPMDQLTIIFSAFSVGIGFGLQNIFNNLVSGIILLFERPVQIGDTVEVGTLIGNVHSMGIRSSHIHTFDGAEVIVPNGQLISQEVVNWTLSDKTRRIEIFSGVAYGSDVHHVQELLLEAINKHPDVIKSPAPLVLFNNLGESSLDFRLLFWTDKFEQWIRIRSEVMFTIYDTLNANGISIPFPQRDLHIKSFNGDILGNNKIVKSDD